MGRCLHRQPAAGEWTPASGLVWVFILFVKVLELCQPQWLLWAQVTGVHTSQSWFKPLSSFGVWDEISRAETLNLGWERHGRGISGTAGSLQPAQLCCRSPGWRCCGEAQPCAWNPSIRCGPDRIRWGPGRLTPRSIPVQLLSSSFATAPAPCRARNLLDGYRICCQPKRLLFYFSLLVNLSGLLKQTC